MSKNNTAVHTEAKINSSFHSCLQPAVNLYIISSNLSFTEEVSDLPVAEKHSLLLFS